MGWQIWYDWTNTLVLGPGSSHHWVTWLWRFLGKIWWSSAVSHSSCISGKTKTTTNQTKSKSVMSHPPPWPKKKIKNQKKPKKQNQEPIHPREITHFIPTVEASDSMQTGTENWRDGILLCREAWRGVPWEVFHAVCTWDFFISLPFIYSCLLCVHQGLHLTPSP